MKELRLKCYNRVSMIIATDITAVEAINLLKKNEVPSNERVVNFTNIKQIEFLTQNKEPGAEKINDLLLFVVSDNVEKHLPIIHAYVEWTGSSVDIVLLGEKGMTLLGDEIMPVKVVPSDMIHESPEITLPEHPVDEVEVDTSFDNTPECIMDFLSAFKYMQTGGKVRRLGDPTHSVYGYQAGYTTPAMPGWNLPEGDHVVIEPQLIKQNEGSFDLSWRPSASDLEAHNYISNKTYLLPMEFVGDSRYSSRINYELITLPDPSKGTGTLDDAMPIVTDETIRTVIIVTGVVGNGGDLLACMLTDMRKNFLTPNWGCATIFNDRDLGPWDTTVLNTVQIISSDAANEDLMMARLIELSEEYGRCGLVIDIHSIVEELVDKGMDYNQANEVCVGMANFWAQLSETEDMPGDYKLWIADLEEMRNQQGEFNK